MCLHTPAHKDVEHPAGQVAVATEAKAEPFDTLAFIMAWEEGDMDDEEMIVGFQHLIDSGLAWQLQGMYGRTAAALIKAGLCTPYHGPFPVLPYARMVCSNKLICKKE